MVITILFIITKLTSVLCLSWWWILIPIIMDGIIYNNRVDNYHIEEQSFAEGFNAGRRSSPHEDYTDYYDN